MQATALKTHKIKLGEALFTILDTYLTTIKEQTVIAIASKLVSHCEQRVVPKTRDKTQLIAQEAEACFTPPPRLQNFYLTLKDHRLIPNAGIDESNCRAGYILLPKDPLRTAREVWQYLRQTRQLQELGVLITDSNITPLRTGVVGIALGWCGFYPIYDYTKQKDLFGHPLTVTKINLIDSLATVATLVMGEGNEQSPLALIRELPKIRFQDTPPNAQERRLVQMPKTQDLFSFLNPEA